MRSGPGGSGSWCAWWLCALCCCLAWLPGAVPAFRASVQLPTGQPAVALGGDSAPVAVARPGEALSGLILIEQDAGEAAGGVEVELAPEGGAAAAGLVVQPPAGMERPATQPGAMRRAIEIPGAISPFLLQFKITAPQNPGRYSIQIMIVPSATTGAPERGAVRGALTVEVMPTDAMTGAVAIERVIFPADAEGRPWTGRASDTVAWPSAIWGTAARLMGRSTGHNPYEPYAWLGVRVKNGKSQIATVIVETGPVVAAERSHQPSAFSLQPSAISLQPSAISQQQTAVVAAEDSASHINSSSHIQNASHTQSGTEVKSEMRNAKSEISSLFAYDWWQERPRTLTQAAMLTLGPGEERTVALPLFVSPATPAGRYACPIAVRPGGGGEPLSAQVYHFRVLRERGGVAAFVIILAAVTAAGVLMLPGYLRRLLPRLYVRQMVLVSLFGALIVAGALLVNVVNSPLQGLLGPFNAFVGGFFYRLLMAALWLSLLTLLPYRGVVTLTALIGYVIGGIFFGSFNPMDFILVGSGILYKETLLWACGATRALPEPGAGARPELPPEPGAGAKPKMPPEPGMGFVGRVAVALGLAEAASTFTSLALQMVFYRLYFAEWYIVAVVVVQSFGYMALGVWLARGPARLVHRLSSPTL